jgi:predicted NAD/FAD-dependent oxidoreductase
MRLAVLGAGPAGLAAAHALSPDAHVTVFEKSRGVSGRAATRWRDAPGQPALAEDHTPFRWRYDHGAQYLGPDPDSGVGRYLRELLGDDLVEIDGAVWPFDDAGTLHPDEARQDSARWTLADGIAGLGRRLVEAAPALDLRLETRVARLARDGGGWAVETDAGDRHAGLADADLRFDAVLLTAPAPQTADLLRTSSLGGADRATLIDALGGADYRSQFTVVWAFDTEIDRPADVYALVNAAGEHGGGGHDVAWLAVESDKPNRAPVGASLLVAQMAPAWTEAHYDDDRAEVVRAAAEAVEGLWGPLPAPLWTDTQRWRYSLPNGAADTDVLEGAAEHDLFFAGDFTAGKGRVHLAVEEGRRAAVRIRQSVASLQSAS